MSTTFRKGQVIYTSTHRLQITRITSLGNLMVSSTDLRTGAKGGSINYGDAADFAAYLARSAELAQR